MSLAADYSWYGSISPKQADDYSRIAGPITGGDLPNFFNYRVIYECRFLALQAPKTLESQYKSAGGGAT